MIYLTKRAHKPSRRSPRPLRVSSSFPRFSASSGALRAPCYPLFSLSLSPASSHPWSPAPVFPYLTAFQLRSNFTSLVNLLVNFLKFTCKKYTCKFTSKFQYFRQLVTTCKFTSKYL